MTQDSNSSSNLQQQVKSLKQWPRKVHYHKGAYSLKELYKYYIKDEDTFNYNIDRKLYREILKRVHQKMMKYIIEESGTISLPMSMGTLRIRKSKPKYDKNRKEIVYAVDHLNSKKYGKKIIHMNNHTDGYIMRFFWDKRCGYSLRILGIQVYCFKAVHDNKMHLARTIIKHYPKIDYFE